MTRRAIGYFVQRATKQVELQKFLEALPPGTLESGVETIPDPELRKRFKLRSPKITKALAKFGVPNEVISGYYAGFTGSRINYQPRVYHISTFNNAAIMKQQSDSTHYSSCMSPSGCYYDDHIYDDMEDYVNGGLGMFVVGNPRHTIEEWSPDETCYVRQKHEGNGDGFISRAKFRLLYEVEDAPSTEQPIAVLIDTLYGSQSAFVKHLRYFVSWVYDTYKVPVITRLVETGKPARHHFPDVLELFAKAYHGYQDIVSASDGNVTFSATYKAVYPWSVLEDCLQTKAYREKKKLVESDSFYASLPPSKIYVDLGSGKVETLVKRPKARQNRHRYIVYSSSQCERARRFKQWRVRFRQMLKAYLSKTEKTIKYVNTSKALKSTHSSDFQYQATRGGRLLAFEVDVAIGTIRLLVTVAVLVERPSDVNYNTSSDRTYVKLLVEGEGNNFFHTTYTMSLDEAVDYEEEMDPSLRSLVYSVLPWDQRNNDNNIKKSATSIVEELNLLRTFLDKC